MKKLSTALKCIFAAAAAGAAFTLAGCSACGTKYPTREECIPEKLGESEGLWLYLENTRSRTDGTEEETLLTDIVIDGETYSAESYNISSTHYAKSAHKILYELQLSTDGSRHVYSYDYKEKSGKHLYAIPYPWYYLSYSENYFFVENANAEYYVDEDISLLYDLDGQLVCDELYSRENLKYDYSTHSATQGILDGDLLYCFTANQTSKNILRWFKDGQLHEVNYTDKLDSVYIRRYGDYFYSWDDKGLHALNLNTAEFSEIDLDLSDADYCYFDDRVYFDGTLYLTVTATYYEKGDYKEKYLFYKINGTNAERICGFTNIGAGGMYVFERDGLIYVTARRNGKYFEYNPESGQINIVKTPKAVEKWNQTEVGGYKFYATEKWYGRFGSDCCYYLCREKDGETEIMQYAFDNYVYRARGFFDDICEF